MRSNFLSTYKKYVWFTKAMRDELVSSKIFVLSAISMQILKQDREQKKLIRLKEIIQVPDIDVFAIIKQLIKITKNNNHDEK